MCMMSKPKAPKMPEPKLPQQPIARQEPAVLAVGRTKEEPDTKKIRKKRQGALRIDRSSIQAPGGMGGSGVNM